MNRGLAASSAASFQLRFPSKSHHGSSISVPFGSFSSNLPATHGSRDLPFYSSKLKYTGCRSGNVPRLSFRCNSSTNPGEPSSQENETKSVLDAFFLGKALAEALNERVESALGEFLSVVGRLQAEQQKQVQEFQEDVLERAKRAKEKAAREAIEARGLVPKSSTENVSKVSNDVAASGSTSSAANSPTPEQSSNESVKTTRRNQNSGYEDPLLGGVSNED